MANKHRGESKLSKVPHPSHCATEKLKVAL